jgi:hypothetical protein
MGVLKDRDRADWFSPEWPNPSAVIQQFGGKELAWTYQQLSASAHGTFFGMRLYRENPDAHWIDPELLGTRGLYFGLLIVPLSHVLVEIRDQVEALGLAQRVSELVARIVIAAQGLAPVPPPM